VVRPHNLRCPYYEPLVWFMIEFVNNQHCPIYFDMYDPCCLLTESCSPKTITFQCLYQQYSNIWICHICVYFGDVPGCIRQDLIYHPEFIEKNFNNALNFSPSITSNDNFITTE